MEEIKMDNKAQGALEYLLLIGGAVLVAVVVIALLSGMINSGGTETAVNTAQNKITNAIENQTL
jgi:uncharacterized protein (UPF0333 family)